jgi:CBS domain-containing protein
MSGELTIDWRVKDVIHVKGPNTATVTGNSTVFDAAALMNSLRIGSVIVVDDDQVVGIFTERDILCRVVATGRDPAGTNVSEVMTAPIVSCGPDTLIKECQRIISGKRIRHLPVLDEGRLVGLISSGDILAYQIRQNQALIEYLNDYVHAGR